MELYRKEYQQLNDKESRVMVAKALKSFSGRSSKFAYIHISPVTVEKCDGYNMELNHSNDRCIRLLFFKSYSKSQTTAMIREIKLLAAKRLQETAGNKADPDSLAFKEALEFLVKL